MNEIIFSGKRFSFIQFFQIESNLLPTRMHRSFTKSFIVCHFAFTVDITWYLVWCISLPQMKSKASLKNPKTNFHTSVYCNWQWFEKSLVWSLCPHYMQSVSRSNALHMLKVLSDFQLYADKAIIKCLTSYIHDVLCIKFKIKMIEKGWMDACIARAKHCCKFIAYNNK